MTWANKYFVNYLTQYTFTIPDYKHQNTKRNSYHKRCIWRAEATPGRYRKAHTAQLAPWPIPRTRFREAVAAVAVPRRNSPRVSVFILTFRDTNSKVRRKTRRKNIFALWSWKMCAKITKVVWWSTHGIVGGVSGSAHSLRLLTIV